MHTAGTVVTKATTHSHAADVRNRHVRSVLADVRAKASTSAEPTRRIVASACAKLKDPIAATELPSTSGMARAVRRIRHVANALPDDPGTLAELKIEDEFTKTEKGDNFLLFDNMDAENRIIIMTTNANLTFMLNCDDLYMDGTFSVTPPLFKQLYTIHGKYFHKNGI